MIRRALGLVALSALCSACATYERGTLAAASTAPVPLDLVVVAERVEGRSCGGEVFRERFRLAVDKALGAAPGANALVDVAYSFERLCIVVRGAAVRVAPPPSRNRTGALGR